MSVGLLEQALLLLHTAHAIQVGTRRRSMPPPLTRLQAGRLAQELATVIGYTRVHLHPDPAQGHQLPAGVDELVEQARQGTEWFSSQNACGPHPVVDRVAEAVMVLRESWSTIRKPDLTRLAGILQATATIAEVVANDGQPGRDTTWQPAAHAISRASQAVHAAGQP